MKIIVKAIWTFAFALILGWTVGAQNTLPQPREEKLLNGLKVLMWPDSKSGSVLVRVRIHSGSSFDPQGKEGVIKLLAENIFPEPAAREFFKEDLGGGLELISNYDYIEIVARSKPENLLTMLETLAAAIANPTIDKPTTAKLKASLLALVKEREADPAYVADLSAASRLLGTFPYGRPQMGSSESIAKVDFADLIDAKQRFLTADNATVVVAGNFDRALGFRAIRRYFGAWLKSDKKVPSTFRQPDPPPAGVLALSSPVEGTHEVRYSLRGSARNGRSFAASRVFAAIVETRLRAGVPAAHSADVFVRSDSHLLPGMITIGFSGKRSDNVEANGKVEANDLVARALAEPISESEFQSAKRSFQEEWAKTDVYTFFLDADTFKTTSPDADARIADMVTLDDVRSFATAARTQPMAAVVVNSPSSRK